MHGPSTTLSSRAGAALLKRFAARGVAVARADYERPSGRVAAWRLGARTATARVVVAHATGNDAFYPHAALTFALLDAGYEVFVFDLDGHGVESTTRLGVATATGMIEAALARAARDGPTLPTHLVGMSLGAALAVGAAADGVAVASVTGISTPTRLVLTPAAASAELLSMTRGAYWHLAKDYGALGLAPALGPFRRAAFPVRLDDVRSDKAGAWRYPATVDRLVRGLGLLERIGALRVPFLALQGAHDHIVPRADGETLVRRAPRATLVHVAGATHFTTPLEPRAIAAVTAFLKEQAA